MVKILIACEYSGVVRRAFRKLGFDAWSCDLLKSEDDSPNHIVGNATELLEDFWDLLIAHPPCTRLCNSGVRWLNSPPKGKTIEQMHEELIAGAALFSRFWNCKIPYKAIENPRMHRHAKELIENYREPDQVIQPFEYGHNESKATCLWLQGLPSLKPTEIIKNYHPELGLLLAPKESIHRAPPSVDRWKFRSRTFEGIAAAMAQQWSTYLWQTTQTNSKTS